MARRSTEAVRAADPAPEPAVLADEVKLILPPDLGFVAARTLKDELLAVREAPCVIFDASGVTRMTTAAVLVLASFLNARAALTPPAVALNPSGAFVDAFSELGLFGMLMRMEFRS